MSIEKPKQLLSVVARGRKLKGNRRGIFFTVPFEIARRIGIEPGDMLELEVRKVTRNPGPEEQAKDVSVALAVGNPN